MKNTEALLHAFEVAQAEEGDSAHEFPDDRLKLLFVCSHPAIDPAARAPLSLQTVLGLDAARIASAFLVSPSAMSQRLVRAKMKIREARIPFHVPKPEEWAERLEFVLDAIYVAFNTGWENAFNAEFEGSELAEEAIFLGRVLVQLAPNEPEAIGLLALMLHCQARHLARRGSDGAFIPLLTQDTKLWSLPRMAEANDLIRRAATFGQVGRFQLEAAIQSVHAARAHTGHVHWPAIELFYQRLRGFTMAIGVQIGHALAVAEVRGAAEGYALLEAVESERVKEHQPYWVARGHLLFRLGKTEEAKVAYHRAIGLTEDAAVRAFLTQTLQNLTPS